MIKKTIVLLAPILALGYIVFGGNADSYRTATVQIDQFQAETTFKVGKSIFKKPNLTATPRFKVNRYKKYLQNNNLSEKFAEAKNNAEDLSENNVDQKPNTTKEQKIAENKTDEEKEKEDQDAKKKEEEKKTAENDAKDEVNDLARNKKKEEFKPSSFSNNDTFAVHSTTLSSAAPIVAEEADVETNNESDSSGSNGTGPRSSDDTVESFGLFTAGYFRTLLSENRLIEFEQALSSIDLTTEQKDTAYVEALKYLFTLEENLERFFAYDSFIRTQFLKDHSFATSIAKSFSEGITTDQITYSANLLNHLVMSWGTEHGSADDFNLIYETSVLSLIPQNILENEDIIGLHKAIELVAIDISGTSTIEVSAI